MHARRDDGYEIATDPHRLDLDTVHRWLSEDAYWSRGRSPAKTEQAVRGSLNYGVYAPEGTQAGYGRVITDKATFAWLCDVYIDPAQRGRGLGSWLATTIRDHLTTYPLTRIMLATADAHTLYAKAGFTPVPDPTELMLLRPDPAP
ncbi:GNAT family N-acetyltransferase [Streptomyces albus]|uniref:GNAT family N-acetyltransferase n=1 Tax=Streptomyces albus TaxID=1888 RepID=UPI0033CD60D3